MPLESSIVKAIRRWLKSEYGDSVYIHKFHGSAGTGIPDLLVVWKADKRYLDYRRTLWLEVKQPDKKPTKRQLAEHAKLRKAGAKVHVVSSVEQVKELF